MQRADPTYTLWWPWCVPMRPAATGCAATRRATPSAPSSPGKAPRPTPSSDRPVTSKRPLAIPPLRSSDAGNADRGRRRADGVAGKEKGPTLPSRAFRCSGVPTGIRTPVAAVKGRCPRPLDDGDGDLVETTGPAMKPARIFRNLVELGGIEPPTSTLPV